MSVMPASPPARAPHSYSCGTLKYTTFGLIMLFVWLLWGDFINTLLDGSIPNILPFKLKEMGASGTEIQVLIRSFGCAISFLFAPPVGFHSDRHRGRWGRRIPYLIWSTPFVALFMILIGHYDVVTRLFIGDWEQVTVLGFIPLSRATVVIMIFGALLICYDFANIFVGCLYWYLFNDVVPQAVMTRYMALFRVVGIGAGSLYSGYIFPHSLEHFGLIFTVGGIAYMAGFLVMCFMVKEGQYGPPPENVDKGKGFVSSMKTFFKECFTHRFYWYFFLTSMFFFLSGQAGTFRGLRDRYSLGLTLQDLGTLGEWSGYANMLFLILLIPLAWIADRLHPLRVYVVLTLICFLSPLAQCIWLFTDFGPHGNLVGQYIIAFAILPLAGVQGLVEIPMYMRVLPKERYGQFCSANASFRALAMMIGSVVAGLMMDALGHYTGLGEWRYRYYIVWQVFFTIPGLVFMLLMYREWKARGGLKGYTPPEV